MIYVEMSGAGGGAAPSYNITAGSGRLSLEFQPGGGNAEPTLIFKIDGHEVKRLPDRSVTPNKLLSFPFSFIMTEDLPIADVNCLANYLVDAEVDLYLRGRATGDVEAFKSTDPLPTPVGSQPITQPPGWPTGTPWYNPTLQDGFTADPDDYPGLDLTDLDSYVYDDNGTDY